VRGGQATYGLERGFSARLVEVHQRVVHQHGRPTIGPENLNEGKPRREEDLLSRGTAQTRGSWAVGYLQVMSMPRRADDRAHLRTQANVRVALSREETQYAAHVGLEDDAGLRECLLLRLQHYLSRQLVHGQPLGQGGLALQQALEPPLECIHRIRVEHRSRDTKLRLPDQVILGFAPPLRLLDLGDELLVLLG